MVVFTIKMVDNSIKYNFFSTIMLVSLQSLSVRSKYVAVP